MAALVDFLPTINEPINAKLGAELNSENLSTVGSYQHGDAPKF